VRVQRWVPLCVLMTAMAAAQSPAPVQLTELERLKAKAEQMSEHDRGKIYSEIARQLTDDAGRQFGEGQFAEGHATVKEVVEFSEKAAAAAKLRNKKTKDTEINLRKTARRLEEIEKTLAVEERPTVKAAVEKLDQIRKELLEYFLKRG